MITEIIEFAGFDGHLVPICIPARNSRLHGDGCFDLLDKLELRLSVFVSKKIKYTNLKVCHPERAKRVEGSTHQIDCNCYHNCEDPSTSLRFATFRSG